MNMLKQKKSLNNKTYFSVSVLGKNLKLNIKYKNISIIELNKEENEIDLSLPKSYKNSDNIDILNIAIKKLYEKIAEEQIEYSMEVARHLLKFAPEDYKIERLNDGFYKCKNKVIIINPDIVQYNKEIIDTTIIQAFCKIKYKTNSAIYKETLSIAIRNYENYKKPQTNKKLWYLSA